LDFWGNGHSYRDSPVFVIQNLIIGNNKKHHRDTEDTEFFLLIQSTTGLGKAKMKLV